MRILIKLVSVFAFSLIFINAAYANKFFIQGEFQLGGDELITSSGSDSLDAGGGVGLGLGYQFDLDEAESAIRFNFIMVSGSISGSNGSADWDHNALEAMYIRKFDNKNFGVGIAMHNNPALDSSFSGGVDVDYDNASGLILHLGFETSDTLEAGLKYTSIEYDASGYESVSGDSLGIFVNYSF